MYSKRLEINMEKSTFRICITVVFIDLKKFLLLNKVNT